MLGAERAAFLRSPGFDYNPLVYGHVNERLPYFLFSREFAERPIPSCIWQGDHATMNCTQPFVQVNLTNDPSSDEPTAHRKQLTPVLEHGCRPFDHRCGSTRG